MATHELARWVPRTKLQAPRLRDDLVIRPRLTAALDRGVRTCRLTLVCAPAGYGKTTLLTHLSQVRRDLPVAWLTLDQEDNHPLRFFYALLAALQELAPACGVQTPAILGDRPHPEQDLRRIMGVLVNSILETLPSEFVLALDDLHLIRTPAVFAALDYLLETMPQQMKLVISSRYDPPLGLARLRAQGDLVEIRVGDLRFTRQETSHLLNRQLQLALTEHDLDALQGRTEGWVAGLRLFAGSLDRLPVDRRTTWVDQIAHTDRHIFDLLADEVLNRQESNIRTFLLQTAILPELTPARCRHVTGRVDAGLLLEEIYRRNLFLSAVAEPDGLVLEAKPGDKDTDTPAYRYHALFADFLQRRLHQEQPAEIPELHRRAALAEPMSAHRVEHCLAAGLWDEAATTIEEIGRPLRRRGALTTLRTWIDALPVDVRTLHPRLLLFLGACAREQGDLEQAERYLRQALDVFRAASDSAGEGDALMDLVNVYSARHDYSHHAELIRQALDKPLPPAGRVQMLVMRAWQALYRGDWEQVDRDMGEATQTTLVSRDPDAFHCLAIQLREPMVLLPDGPARMERYSRTALAYAESHDAGPVPRRALTLLSYVHLWRGDLAQAEAGVRQAQRLSAALGGFTFIDLGHDLMLSTLYLSRSDYTAAEEYWKERIPAIEQSPGAREWLAPSLFKFAQIYLVQGRLDEARALYARMEAVHHGGSVPESTICCSIMAAAIAWAEGRHNRAEELLRRAADLQKVMRHSLIFTNAHLRLAHYYLETSASGPALEILEPLLAKCALHETPGPLLVDGPAIAIPVLRFAWRHSVEREFCCEVLNLYEVQPRVADRGLPLPQTNESLTPREVDVLELLVTGQTNRSIAESLVITERTVKSHVTSILRKLNVASRTEATARVHELSLLE